MGMVCKKCKNYIVGNKQPYRCPVCSDFECYEKTERNDFIQCICVKCGTKTKRIDFDEYDEMCHACDESLALTKLDISEKDVLIAGIMGLDSKYSEYQTISLDSLEEDLAEYLGVGEYDLDWLLFTDAIEYLENQGVITQHKVIIYNQ